MPQGGAEKPASPPWRAPWLIGVLAAAGLLALVSAFAAAAAALQAQADRAVA